jgi:hypothetical protein
MRLRGGSRYKIKTVFVFQPFLFKSVTLFQGQICFRSERNMKVACSFGKLYGKNAIRTYLMLTRNQAYANISGKIKSAHGSRQVPEGKTKMQEKISSITLN